MKTMNKIMHLIEGLLEELKCENIRVWYDEDNDSIEVKYDLPDDFPKELIISRKMAIDAAINLIIEHNIDDVIAEREKMENVLSEEEMNEMIDDILQ